jgi:cell division protein FtsL
MQQQHISAKQITPKVTVRVQSSTISRVGYVLYIASLIHASAVALGIVKL